MGSLLIPLLGSAAAKAGDALLDNLLRSWNLEDDRRRLERHFLAVKSILLDADAKSRTSDAVRAWMNDLKTAAYKADHVLDDFRYEALRRNAHIRGSTTRKVLSYFTLNCPVVFRLFMSKKLKDVLEKIDELVEEMNKFHFQAHTEAPNTDRPQTHSCVVESEIVGKEEEMEKVVNILLNHSDKERFTVLPIFGMGGVGKTTLAQLVYNHERVRRHFELLLWVCVSDKFIIEELIRCMIQVATMKKCDLSETEALQKELGEVLEKKKFLLVLDDVWNEDERKWDGLRSLLSSHAGSGSAIVVTSRSSQVGSIMGTIDPYQISPLDDDPSWKLFRGRAFRRGVEEQPEVISIAKKIVKKCNGLPLAINTIATLLSSKRPSEWYSVLDSDIWVSDNNNTKNALKLSYDHLSLEAKMCFSFCAVFPKDSLMEKDMLIQLWIANDFIASETRGHEIFDELVWRCFLQDIVELQTNMPGLSLHRPTTCKMHDLMHDLAESISGNDCSILQESSPPEIMQGSTHASSKLYVRHLSADSADTGAVIKEILAPRTILFLRGQRQGISLSMAKSKFTFLRALKTFDVHSVMTHITHLKHLRYLDLSYSDIVLLPEATAMLYSLQTLRLIGCDSLKELPEGMRYMSGLRHVFLVGCLRLKRMPAGIGQLNCLQTLTNYVVGSEAGRGIDQLNDLNLGGSLQLSKLEKVQSAENAKQCNISSMHNLNRLSLKWGFCFNREEVIRVHLPDGILEALHPPNRLEALELYGYTGAKFSSWMQNSTLLHLTELRLDRCRNCKDLPLLWQLPSLRYLILNRMDSLASICSTSIDKGNGESCISPPTFLKLETMYVCGMPKLERWHQELAGQVAAVSFPQLKKLDIRGCPMLATMPNLPLLEDLQVEDSEKVPLYHLMQNNLGYNGSIVVESVGLQPLDFHFSRLCDSELSLEFRGLMENEELIEQELNRIPCRFIKKLSIEDCNCFFSSEPSKIPLRSIWRQFSFVEEVLIVGCSNIVQWPVGELFGNLNCLRSLELKHCPNLIGSFPSTSDDQQGVLIPQVEKLVIYHCGSLVQMPNMPASLEILHVQECPRLVSLPANLGNLTKLRELQMFGCDSLTRYPDGMDGLSSLKKLCIGGCRGVETLPEGLLQQLPALEELDIEGCPDLEIPKLLASLEKLRVWDCPRLVSLPANLGNLTKLRELTVYSCPSLTGFPDGMDGFTFLKELMIGWCPGLETLPEGLRLQLPALEELDILGCPNLERGFSRGGAYWDLIQAIPKAKIGKRDIHQKETAQDDDNFTGQCAKSLARVQSMCLPCV